MELSVVIVNYNVKEFLRLCLKSVRLASAQVNTEVFVVDNNSSDGSIDMVKTEFPEFVAIANKENVGFAVANNQAIKQASGKYVLLLNPDTVVAEDTFKVIVHFMNKHHDVGGLGVRMVDGGGCFLPESKRGIPSPWVSFCKMSGLGILFPKSKIFNAYYKGHISEYSTSEVDVLSGAFMCMPKAVLDKVGLLDEDFFMYGEDIDLSYRITLGGYKNYYLPTTTIVHFKGESTIKDKVYIKRFFKAMIQFSHKHFTSGNGKIMILFIRIGVLITQLLTMATYLVRAFKKKPEISSKNIPNLYYSASPKSKEYLQLSEKIAVRELSDLGSRNNGIVLFSTNQGLFKDYISTMNMYGSQFYYRFYDSNSNSVIGSDSKDRNGIVVKL